MVVGSAGAGKSTFARQLGTVTGLPVTHLDRHHWHAGWTPTPKDEWRQKVEQLASADQWIIDGDYGGTLSIRAERCDAIVFFDFGRLVCLWGVIKRRLLQRGQTRPDMAEGCAERLDPSFLRWIWQYRKTSRPKVVEAIDAAKSHAEIVVIQTRRDVRRLLRDIHIDGPNFLGIGLVADGTGSGGARRRRHY